MVEITGSTSIPANHPFLFFSLGSSHLVPVGWSHHWQQKRSSAIQHKSHIPTSVTIQGTWTKLVQAELNAWQLFSDWGKSFSPLMVWYSGVTHGPTAAEWKGTEAGSWPTEEQRSTLHHSEPSLPFLWSFQACKPIKLLYSLHNIIFLIITKPCYKKQCGKTLWS